MRGILRLRIRGLWSRSSRRRKEKGLPGLAKEREELYSLTPMEQLAKLQQMMDQAAGGGETTLPRPGGVSETVGTGPDSI